MTNTGKTVDATRQLVLEAAVDELSTGSVGSFTMERVAARAGVDVGTVRQMWPNTPELFTEVMKFYGDRHIPIPDTGTLHGDLLAYARSYAASVNTTTGRRLLDAVIVKRADWDLTDSRATFLAGRASRIAVIVERGIQRGECPADTDPALTIDMLGTGICLPVLYYDQPVSDEHCQYVVRTLLTGITGER